MNCFDVKCTAVNWPRGNTIEGAALIPEINGEPENFLNTTHHMVRTLPHGNDRGMGIECIIRQVLTDRVIITVPGPGQRFDGVVDIILTYNKPDLITDGDNTRTIRFFGAVNFYSREDQKCGAQSECSEIELPELEINAEIEICGYSGSAFDEAPIDGNLYGRMNGAWEQINENVNVITVTI